MSRDDLWAHPIGVAAHAADRIFDRIGWDDLDRVRGEVRVCLLEGRSSAEQPSWTRSAAVASRHPRPGRFYVWDETFERCWIVQRDRGTLWVVTVLLDESERAASAQRQLLRPGSRR